MKLNRATSRFHFNSVFISLILNNIFFGLMRSVIALSLSSSTSSLSSSGKSCAVVGVGVLGTSLCKQILSSPHFANVEVTGITKSNDRHEMIREQVGSSKRLKLVTSQELMEHGEPEKFDNVVFCAPPSGFEDYPAAIEEAVKEYWSGPDKGVFVFTSSGAVYGPGDSGTVTELSPTADITNNPRIERLVKAEEACLKGGGCCLRLAGLYSLTRGAHNFWITGGKPVAGHPDGMINLLHYDDAAGACLAALKAGPSTCKGKVFLISDGQPLTRYAICENALKARVYANYDMPAFNNPDGQSWARGKVYDGSDSNKALNWKPEYVSFEEFMESNS